MAINLFKSERDVRAFSRGQPIFTDGDPGDAMYAVVEGSVDIVWRGRPLETVEAGGVFGELALLDDRPRSASAVARTDCKVAVIDLKRFETLVRQSPFFAVEVMRVMADRLRRRTV